MKTIGIEFIAKAQFFKEIEVDNDFDYTNINPIQLVEKLQEKYPDQFIDDILSDEYDFIYHDGDVTLEEMGFEYIDYVSVRDEKGYIIYEKGYDIPKTQNHSLTDFSICPQ